MYRYIDKNHIPDWFFSLVRFIFVLFSLILFSFEALGLNQKNNCAPDLKKPTKIHKNIVDFNGDGKSDFSVVSTKNHTLYVEGQPLRSWRASFGKSFPILGDYDGDSKTEMALYDKGIWHIFGFMITKLGEAGDIPVPGDYDGDGTADIAVWRPQNGVWQFASLEKNVIWGKRNDIPIPMDYDGDGRTDVAVWRPSDGKWYIQNSSGGQSVISWGKEGDIPVPGDYNGDKKAEIAVWRPSNGNWYIKDREIIKFGNRVDIPVPGDYNGDGKLDLAVWRFPDGEWIVRGQGSINLTHTQAIPMTWNIWTLYRTNYLALDDRLYEN